MRQSFFLVVLIITSCSAGHHSYSDAANWVPVDFDPAKNVLVVETYPIKEKWNNSMRELLYKHFAGKYEIADEQSILSPTGKYSDTKKYRYAVLWRVIHGGTSSTHQSFSPGTIMNTTYHDATLDINGYFRDRANGKNYPETKKYNNYGWQGFVPFFNSVIKESKKK